MTTTFQPWRRCPFAGGSVWLFVRSTFFIYVLHGFFHHILEFAKGFEYLYIILNHGIKVPSGSMVCRVSDAQLMDSGTCTIGVLILAGERSLQKIGPNSPSRQEGVLVACLPSLFDAGVWFRRLLLGIFVRQVRAERFS